MPKNDIQTEILSSKGKVLKSYDATDNLKNQTLSFYCKPTATATALQAVADALDNVFKQGTVENVPTSQLLQQVEITGAN